MVKQYAIILFLNKNLNASRPSEHPSVRGKKNSKRFGGIIGCNYISHNNSGNCNAFEKILKHKAPVRYNDDKHYDNDPRLSQIIIRVKKKKRNKTWYMYTYIYLVYGVISKHAMQTK